MKIREYDDLTPEEQDKLSHAWVTIVEGVSVYEQITGANQLDDAVYDAIWDRVGWQKSHVAE